MKLTDIYEFDKGIRLTTLYKLLAERTPEQSISHKEMPTFAEHEEFVESLPYPVWYFICNEDQVYGSIYLTDDKEIGMFLFEKYQGWGIADKAFKEFLKHHNGPFLANVNPQNQASINFFQKQGFRHIQQTYKYEASS